MNTKKWTIGKRVAFLGGCLLANILVIWGVSKWNAVRLSRELDLLTHVHIVATRDMAMLDMMHDGLRAVAYRSLLAAEGQDKNEFEETRAELEEFSKNFDELQSKLSELELSTAAKTALAAAKPDIAGYKTAAHDLVTAALSGKKEKAMDLKADFQEKFSKLEGSLGKLGELIEADAQRVSIEANDLIKSADLWALILLFVGLGLGLLNTWMSARNLVAGVVEILNGLSQQASNVQLNSGAISDASNALQGATQQQAAAIQETSSALEETNAMVQRSSDNATQSRTVATRSQQIAADGKKAVESMIVSISEINDTTNRIGTQVAEGHDKIAEIVDVINQIGQKSKVINDIVFQTKLLSFNASVEAARAGEHGKGFAVVAEEVGNLAQMSGNAAKEINDMLESSIEKVQQIVSQTKIEVERLIETGKHKVQAGTEVAQSCGRILEEVVSNVSELNNRIDEISTASQEQAQGINEINRAIHELNKTTQENSVTAAKAADVATSLAGESQQLVRAVNSLAEFSGVDSKMGSSARSSAGPVAAVNFKSFGAESPKPKADSARRPGLKKVWK